MTSDCHVFKFHWHSLNGALYLLGFLESDAFIPRELMRHFIFPVDSTGYKKKNLVNISGLPPTKMPLIAGQEDYVINCNFS